MSNQKLKAAFNKICREKPSETDIAELRDYEDQKEMVAFLLGKCRDMYALAQTDLEWNSTMELGVINSIPILVSVDLESSIETILDILEDVVDDPDAGIYNTIMVSLEGAGARALEPIYARYERSRNLHLNYDAWPWLLATLGVRDTRIYAALLDFARYDLAQTVNMMSYYGDKAFVPFIEEYVTCLARYLNDNKIDPFIPGRSFDDFLISDYFGARETLVYLRESGQKPETPREFELLDKKIVELDHRLLKHADFEAYEKNMKKAEEKIKQLAREEFSFEWGDEGLREEIHRIGRNDPCPCGSGKKYKKCCGSET